MSERRDWGTSDHPMTLEEHLAARRGPGFSGQTEAPLDETAFYLLNVSFQGTSKDAAAWYHAFLDFVSKQVDANPSLPSFLSVALSKADDDDEEEPTP